jgi:SAM-dependent methyltransferase
MIKKIINKLSMVFKKHEFSATIILKRIIIELANYSDRFKRLILLAVGVIKYSRGLRREARAYWMFTIPMLHNAKMTTEVDSEYDEKFYARLEDANYKAYIESAKKIVLSTYPEKTDAICDIGCGRGVLVKVLQGDGYTKAIGIEISRYAIEHKVVDNVYLRNINYFKENQFKVVSLIDVLEHLKKEEIQDFLKEAARITDDYLVCSIPIYPNNLFDFFREPDHRTFERRGWWDEEFKKAGFCPWVLPKEPLPFIAPFVYRKVKEVQKSKKVLQTNNFPQIHFAIDLSLSNAFTWVTAKLALALDSLGYGVSINPASLCTTIAVEDRMRLGQLMRRTPCKDVQIKWYFEEGDESIEELGVHYEQTIQIPFEHIEYY